MDIFKKIKELNLPKGQYVIFGSGPLAAHNIRETKDIDILALPELKNLFTKKGFKEKVFPDGSVFFVKDVYEVGFVWDYGEYKPDTKYLIETAEYVKDIPFVKLDEVIKWKKVFGRDKDKRDIKLIEKYLKSENK